ncbi:hypothetical protein CDAR_535041 [Caerostris darwini]|uniref:C2H2-type domain-containing protein n=1 Tax=Caerostris darwini TaxID=1538125 RepID=A0AAV4QIL8_9ARAC|nr:hypothetical protein CDAR_535041 [Caerostris darwini]
MHNKELISLQLDEKCLVLGTCYYRIKFSVVAVDEEGLPLIVSYQTLHPSKPVKYEKYIHQKKSNRFLCPHCPYSSNISTNFKHHMLTHSTERPFTCPVCGMGFIQKQNMKNHMVQHNKTIYVQQQTCVDSGN